MDSEYAEVRRLTQSGGCCLGLAAARAFAHIGMSAGSRWTFHASRSRLAPIALRASASESAWRSDQRGQMNRRDEANQRGQVISAAR
jgi:hypothetical protein